jgi:hypothetical protein
MYWKTTSINRCYYEKTNKIISYIEAWNFSIAFLYPSFLFPSLYLMIALSPLRIYVQLSAFAFKLGILFWVQERI